MAWKFLISCGNLKFPEKQIIPCRRKTWTKALNASELVSKSAVIAQIQGLLLFVNCLYQIWCYLDLWSWCNSTSIRTYIIGYYNPSDRITLILYMRSGAYSLTSSHGILLSEFLLRGNPKLKKYFSFHWSNAKKKNNKNIKIRKKKCETTLIRSHGN